MMQAVPINYVAILVAAIASMAIGYFWYSPMGFGKTWMKLAGVSQQSPAAAKKEMPKVMLVSFVGTILTAYVLAHASIFSGAYLHTSGLVLGLTTGFFNWVGFVVPTLLNGVLFEKQPLKLFAIHAGYILVSLLVMGVILTAWV